MAMTTTGVFGQSSIHDPLRGPPPQPQTTQPTQAELNDRLLREAVDKFLKGEITAVQLDALKKTLS